MKKVFKLILVSFLLSGTNAYSKSVVMGGFGTDGASGKPIPVEASVSHAYQVYEALRHLAPDGGKVLIQGSNGEITCNEPIKGIVRLEASCEVGVIDANLIGISESPTMILNFGGELASKLYKELNIDADQSRVGSVTKTVANISCTKVMNQNMTVKCRITDFFGLQMELGPEEI